MNGGFLFEEGFFIFKSLVVRMFAIDACFELFKKQERASFPRFRATVRNLQLGRRAHNSVLPDDD